MGTPDYWGAPVPQPPHDPKAGYFPFPAPPTFTGRPENNTLTIEYIRKQILNQHPEEMSAAADQWQNLYDFIAGIGDKVREKSQTLHDETWKSPEAAATFLKRGPGTTLAALDQWKAAAAANRDALRALVGMTTKARSDMDTLWSQFLKDVDYAKYVHHDNFWDWVNAGWAVIEASFGYNGLSAYEKQKVQDVYDSYNQQARVLAYRVALGYFDIMNHFGVAGQGLGIGPAFKPMNARLSMVGHSPFPGTWPGAVPSGPVPVPPVVPRGLSTAPRIPGRPGAPAVPAVPRVQGAPSLPQVPGAAGLGARVPGGSPGTIPGLGPGSIPLVVPGPVPGTAPGRPVPGVPTLGGPGGRGVGGLHRLFGGAQPGVPSAAGLAQSRVLKAPDSNGLRDPLTVPGEGSALPGQLRSPSATGAGGRPVSGLGAGMEEPPPARGQQADERTRQRVWEPAQGVEEAFNVPPPGAVPAVLSGSKVGRPGAGRGVFGGGSGLGAGVSEPPALRPGGGEAGPPSRRSPKHTATARTVPPGEPGTEWLGLAEALDGASEPVLDAPSEAVVTEDGSVSLRAPTVEVGTMSRAAQTRRRPADQQAVTLAEEDWTVPSPGGGVLGGRVEPSGDDEPGPTLRAVQG